MHVTDIALRKRSRITRGPTGWSVCVTSGAPQLASGDGNQIGGYPEGRGCWWRRAAKAYDRTFWAIEIFYVLISMVVIWIIYLFIELYIKNECILLYIS